MREVEFVAKKKKNGGEHITFTQCFTGRHSQPPSEHQWDDMFYDTEKSVASLKAVPKTVAHF